MILICRNSPLMFRCKYLLSQLHCITFNSLNLVLLKIIKIRKQKSPSPGLADLFCKGSQNNYFRLREVGESILCVATTQPCSCNVKATAQSTLKQECGYVLIKLYICKCKWWTEFGPRAVTG